MKKGFTLVELLIVIGILAVLAAAVVVVLNPAELLKQARDSQRLSDLDSLRSALALYLTDVATPSIGASDNCYVNVTLGANCGGRHAGRTETVDADRTSDGNGWVPVNLTSISGGSPLSALPVDPTNTSPRIYSYAPDATNLTFEINADLESSKYASKETVDGGDRETLYEVGTDPGLNL